LHLHLCTCACVCTCTSAPALAFALAPLHLRLRLHLHLCTCACVCTCTSAPALALHSYFRFHSYLRLHVRLRCETLGSHGLVKDRTCSHSGVNPIGPSYGVMLPCFECVAIVWHHSSLILRRAALLCSGWSVQCVGQLLLLHSMKLSFGSVLRYNVITTSLTREWSGSHL
jgi:hypothetical protein